MNIYNICRDILKLKQILFITFHSLKNKYNKLGLNTGRQSLVYLIWILVKAYAGPVLLSRNQRLEWNISHVFFILIVMVISRSDRTYCKNKTVFHVVKRIYDYL